MLMAKGVTPTSMRLLVLEFLLKQESATDLPTLQREFQHSDRTTLYRTLKTFEEQGLVHAINSGSDAARYALCDVECKPGVHEDMHIHFYCTECRKLSCLPKTNRPLINLPENYQLKQFSIVARGICDECSLRQNNAIGLHD